MKDGQVLVLGLFIGFGIGFGLCGAMYHNGFSNGKAAGLCEAKSGEYRDGKCWTKATVIQ